MKIVSSFRDYYDKVQGILPGSEPVYIRRQRIIFRDLQAAFIIIVSFLCGCATSANRVISHATDNNLAVIPDQAIIQNELKNRALIIGTVAMDVQKLRPKNEHPFPDEAYTALLHHQLITAFESGSLSEGSQPPYVVNVSIEDMRFTPGMFLIPKPSILKSRMEIIRPDETKVMSGSIRSTDMNGFILPLFFGGTSAWIFIPTTGSNIMAHKNLFPAMAVLITKIAAGLKEGKSLEEIILVPNDDRPSPQADYIVEHNDLGLHTLTSKETERIAGIKLSDFTSDDNQGISPTREGNSDNAHK